MIHKKFVFIFTFIIVAILLVWVFLPVSASPQPQAYYLTPTPGADGRIIYTVKAGDNCISVSLSNKVSLDQLRKLNNITGIDCPLIVGQKLVLGIVENLTATPGPSPTPIPLPPSPTPFNGSADICILLYEDVNGNGIVESNETPLSGGAVSLTDRAGKVSLTGSTAGGPDPLCFLKVPEGDYNVSVAVPQGYNATTNTNYPMKVIAGDQIVLDFGAQLSAKAAPTPVSEGGRSPLLGILGGLLVLGGIGLAVLLLTTRRR
jgi:LysM repeat protein